MKTELIDDKSSMQNCVHNFTVANCTKRLMRALSLHVCVQRYSVYSDTCLAHPLHDGGMPHAYQLTRAGLAPMSIYLSGNT
jgi:hypothetical protein